MYVTLDGMETDASDVQESNTLELINVTLEGMEIDESAVQE